MHRFLIIIENDNDNYSVYSPDLPGCVATGVMREETEQNMLEAIELHVWGLQKDNLPISRSHSFEEFVVLWESAR